MGHPCFNDSGPTEMHCFVFPRTAVWIQHEGRAPFVADPNVVPLYNPGQPYRRERISAAGDQTDWFGVAPRVLREMVATRDPRAADSDTLFRFDAAPAGADTYVAQRQVVTALGSGLSRLAAGDVTHRVTEPFANDYDQLRTDFNAAMDSIADMLRAVSAASYGINNGAEDVRQASDDLSQRTEEQAAGFASP